MSAGHVSAFAFWTISYHKTLWELVYKNKHYLLFTSVTINWLLFCCWCFCRTKLPRQQRYWSIMTKRLRRLVAAPLQVKRRSGYQGNLRWRLWRDRASAEAPRSLHQRITMSGFSILWSFSPGCCFQWCLSFWISLTGSTTEESCKRRLWWRMVEDVLEGRVIYSSLFIIKW